MQALHIEVTVNDIKEGKRSNPGGCPHAIAIRRALGQLSRQRLEIFVGASDIQIDKYYINSPTIVSNWIKQFDDQREVQPITYDLVIPAHLWHLLRLSQQSKPDIKEVQERYSAHLLRQAENIIIETWQQGEQKTTHPVFVETLVW
jgi:hypothetical protein